MREKLKETRSVSKIAKNFNLEVVPVMELRDHYGKRIIVKIKAKDFGG